LLAHLARSVLEAEVEAMLAKVDVIVAMKIRELRGGRDDA
jgi:hypothetical protein